MEPDARYPTVAGYCEALTAATKEPQIENREPKPTQPEPTRPQRKKVQGALEKIPSPEEKDYWVWLEPGTFQMGDEQIPHDDEKPAHPVTITRGFWMGRVPVTNASFKAFIDAGGYENSKWWDKEGNRSDEKPRFWESEKYRNSDQPVVGVSWYESRAYCRWLTHHLEQTKPAWSKEGQRVVLPTEAQWEYAARGTEGRKYPWGPESPDEARANFGRKVGSTTAMSAYPGGATPEGLLDLAGNIWEWCQDSWDEKAYQNRKSSVKDPLVENNDPARVLRGGSWSDGSRTMRAAGRNQSHTGRRFAYLGFRRVLLSVSAEHG